VCNRKIGTVSPHLARSISSNMNNNKTAADAAATTGVDSNNLNDSTIFYSSVGVHSLGGGKMSNFEDPNNHDFYCYSAKDGAALFGDEDDDDDDDGDDDNDGEGVGNNAAAIRVEKSALPQTGETTAGAENGVVDVNVNDIEKEAAAQRRKRRHEAREAARARRRSGQTHKQICCYMCCFCCARRLEKTWPCIVLDRANKMLRQFVDSSFFQRLILCGILINTICMGIEHHQQVNFEKSIL
jgi:hypothetical protein